MSTKTNLGEGLKLIQGLHFVTIGPFLVAKLSNKMFESVPVGSHGMEALLESQQTAAHDHAFPSFYKSDRLDIMCDGKRFTLPPKALTLVLPGTQHSWVPQGSAGAVGSVDRRHQKQKIA